MNKEPAAHATEEVLLHHRVSSKRNAAENLGLLCAGALVLAAAWGALDLGLAAETRVALSVAACCALLAGTAFLFPRGRRRRREPQQLAGGVRGKVEQQGSPAGGVRSKVEQQAGEEVIDEPPRPSTSDRLSRSPSCDGGPHEAKTAHKQPAARDEPLTPESAFKRSGVATTACKQQQPGAGGGPTTPEPSSLRRTSRPRKPSRRYSAGDWVL